MAEMEIDLTVQEKSFGIDLVFEKILDNVDIDTKKACRSVCKSWRNNVTDLMLRRQSACIRVRHNSPESRSGPSTGVLEDYFVIKMNGKKETKPLSALCLVIEKSYKFPTNYLKIQCGNLNEAVLRDFLDLFGKFVKVIELLPCNGKNGSVNAIHTDENNAIDCEDFRNMLLLRLPNLEQLKMRPCAHHYAQILDDSQVFRLFMEELRFPQIHTLHIGKEDGSEVVLRNLLKCCTGLRDLEFYVTEESVATVSRANKWNCVRHLEFDPSSKTIPGWESLLSVTLGNLTSLKIHGSALVSEEDMKIKETCRDILRKLLENISATVRQIICFNYNEVCESFTSVLPRVEVMELHESTPRTRRFLRVEAVERGREERERRLRHLIDRVMMRPGPRGRHLIPNEEHENLENAFERFIRMGQGPDGNGDEDMELPGRPHQPADDHVAPPQPPRRNSHRVLPLADIFPNLKSLTLKLIANEVRIQDVFGNTPTAQLQKLIILDAWDNIPDAWFSHLSHLFPNVKHLEIEGPPVLSAVSTGIMQLAELRFLRIKFIKHLYPEQATQVDEAFTGLTGRDSKRLAQCRDEFYFLPNDAVSPNLTDLKNLRTLVLDTDSSFIISDSKRLYPLTLSKVSGILAFRKCPNLKVYLRSERKREDRRKLETQNTPAIRSVLPYVTYIEHQ